MHRPVLLICAICDTQATGGLLVGGFGGRAGKFYCSSSQPSQHCGQALLSPEIPRWSKSPTPIFFVLTNSGYFDFGKSLLETNAGRPIPAELFNTSH